MVGCHSDLAWRAILLERDVFGFDAYADADANDQMYILYDFDCYARLHNPLSRVLKRAERIPVMWTFHSRCTYPGSLAVESNPYFLV